jgi:hypothetical protein
MWKLSRVLVLCSLAAAGVGCTKTKVAVFRTHFGGRIISAETKLGISGVVITLCNYQLTTSTDGNGHWELQVAPGLHDTEVAFTAVRSGFASVGGRVFVDPNDSMLDGGSESTHFVDTGTIEMRPGVDLTVQVTRDTIPLANCTVRATISEFGFDFSAFCSLIGIVAVTNSSGIVVLPNLDPLSYYSIEIQEQDFDGDDLPDIYGTSTSHNIGFQGMFVALNVQSRSYSTSPNIIATNLTNLETSYNMPTGALTATDLKFDFFSNGNSDPNARSAFGDEEVFFSQANTMTDGSVRVVFNTPVVVVAGSGGLEPHFLYFRNLLDPTVVGFAEHVTIAATAVALAGSNSTIWTFTPSSALPTNEVLELLFLARSALDSASADNFSITMYRPLLGNTTINVVADNYNGSVDGAGGVNQVYLAFDEVLWGFYKVLAYTVDGSAVTNPDPSETYFPFYDFDALLYNVTAAAPTGTNVGGSALAVGTAYQVKVFLFGPFGSSLFLNDNTPTVANTVTILFSVIDSEGVIREGVVTLPVN